MPMFTMSVMGLPVYPSTPRRGPSENLHLFQDFFHIGHHIFSRRRWTGLPNVAERHVEHGPPFGLVDASPENIFPMASFSFTRRQVHQEFHRLGGDDILGIVHQHVFERRSKTWRTSGVLTKRSSCCGSFITL